MKKKVYIAESNIENAGRGVFASTDIKKGEVIEICPILIFSEKDNFNVLKTKLQSYVYEYGKNGSMFALGFGSLYNHQARANAKYELVEHEGAPEQNNELYITALKSISKNEEISINYGNDFYQ